MEHDSVATQAVKLSPEMSAQIEEAMSVTTPSQPEQALSRRGRPARLSQTHLAWAVVWGLLMGYRSQLELWRLIGMGFRRFAPLLLCNQAVYKRLSQSGLCALHDVLMQVSGWLGGCLVGLHEERLAPFASDVLVLDESKLDQVGRWLSGLRELPAGDPRLLAGRLSCLFDLRRQQWRGVDVLPEAIVDCKVHARTLLEGLRLGSLLLGDLGYFSFEWFDELTHLGHFWISRLRQKTSYEIIHVLVCRDGYFEALVWLGAYRADRAAHAVRLIQVRYQGRWSSYLTNVLDPCQLSGAEVLRL